MNAFREQNNRRTLDNITARLANLHLQTQTTSENINRVQNKVDHGINSIRNDIKESSNEHRRAFKNLLQRSSVTKLSRTLSEVTLQTLYSYNLSI